MKVHAGQGGHLPEMTRDSNFIEPAVIRFLAVSLDGSRYAYKLFRHNTAWTLPPDIGLLPKNWDITK